MKIDFTSLEEMLNWLKDKSQKYELYIVKSSSEVVAMPTVSTRPVRIGVAKCGKRNEKEVVNAIKDAIPSLEGSVFVVETLDFQIER